MNKGKERYPRLFFGVAALGALYLAVEAVFQLFGSSICAAAGCKVVSQNTRFGDLSIVVLGLAMLGSLAILSRPGAAFSGGGQSRLTTIILIAALAGEGFFTGYQLFHIRTVCVFCVSVLGIVSVLALLRLLAGDRDVAAGFAAFGVVLAFLYLILPAGGRPLPPDGKLTLFYSPDCKHCAEIRRELEEQGIETAHTEVREYAGFLKGMGIEHVPTLYVNGPYEKIFLTGTEAIRRYLLCDAGQKPGAAAAPKRGKTAPKASGGAPENILAPLGAPDLILNPPQEDTGLCREEQKCD